MGILEELAFVGSEGSVLLIDPPTGVMAEAATMTPRPGTASSIQVARPAARIAWWPTRDQLTPATVSRLAWLASAGAGEAWIVVTARDDDSPKPREVRAALSSAGLTPGEERTLSTGELSFRLA